MKTKLLFVAILGLTLSTFSYAQFEVSNLKAGASLVYATDIDNIGLGINGVYSFTDQWEASVGFTHIFENNFVTYNIIDFDARYHFYSISDKSSIYGLAGLGIVSAKIDIPYFGEASNTDVGLNIGAGVNFDVTDVLSVAPEFRFTIAEGSFARIGASVLYNF